MSTNQYTNTYYERQSVRTRHGARTRAEDAIELRARTFALSRATGSRRRAAPHTMLSTGRASDSVDTTPASTRHAAQEPPQAQLRSRHSSGAATAQDPPQR